jgi:hypothetical protein
MDDGRAVNLGEAMCLLVKAANAAQPLRFAAIRYFSLEQGGMVIRYEAWQ